MTRIILSLTFILIAACPGPLPAQDARNAIHETAEQVQPFLPGMMAPAFNVRDVEANAVVFDPAGMDKPLVLTFFRGGWCPYCNLHLAELRHAEGELKELGFDIWFISMDKPELLYESLDQPDTAYTIYSDAQLEATRAFGLAFRVDDATYDRYVSRGLDLERVSAETHHVLPAPSTYIIGSNGIITFQFTNPDYKVRLHPDVLLAAARAYANGEDQRLVRAREASKKNQQK